MDSRLTFALGLLAGAGAGSVATYFLVKEKFAIEAEEEIENYAQHCEERIEKIRKDHAKTVYEEAVETLVKPTNDPNEEAIANNEGVKKYHHSNGLGNTAYGDNHIFEKSQDLKEKREIKNQIKDNKMINEIDEDEFMNAENGYTKQTVDISLGDDEEIVGIWGYETDNEEFVERKFGKPLNELTGIDNYDDYLSFVNPDEGVGVMYLRNEQLMIDFEFVIHDDREDDK